MASLHLLKMRPLQLFSWPIAGPHRQHADYIQNTVKTVFNKIERLTPLRASQLWICAIQVVSVHLIQASNKTDCVVWNSMATMSCCQSIWAALSHSPATEQMANRSRASAGNQLLIHTKVWHKTNRLSSAAVSSSSPFDGVWKWRKQMWEQNLRNMQSL